MGGSDYGVYVYVWTWVLLLGSMMDFGISASAQKIIPEYRTSGEHALLRGFLSGSRWMTFAVSSLVSLLLAGLVKALSPWIDANAIVPLYIGCVTLPAFVVANTQDGIARSHDWMRLGLMPQFIVRQSLIIGLTAGAFVLGFQSRRHRRDAGERRRGVDRDDRPDDRAEPQARQPCRARPQGLRFPRLARGLAADPDGRGLLPAAVLHRRAGAAAIPLVGRGRHLFRRREDAGAGLLHSLRDVGDDRASLLPNITRSATRRGSRPMSRTRSSGRSGRRWPRPSCCWRWASRCCGCSARNSWSATSIMFIAADRPRGARGDRPGRAAAQHARPPAHLRAGLCAGLRDEPRAVRRCWCRASAAMAPRPRPRSRWCSRPCCCSGSCAGGSACTCWRSGSGRPELAEAIGTAAPACYYCPS